MDARADRRLSYMKAFAGLQKTAVSRDAKKGAGLIEPLAVEADLPLNEERLEIIHYIRSYFDSHLSVPEARLVLKHMRGHWGEEKATRRYLYKLFPRGYGQQACKIAGMRKPRKLMLDV